MVWERSPRGKLTNVGQAQNFLDWHDRKGSPEVAILNQTAAERIFPGEDPAMVHREE